VVLVDYSLCRQSARGCDAWPSAQPGASQGAAPGELAEMSRRLFLCAFDLIEIDGEDMRRDPLEMCKATLEVLLGRAAPGVSIQ
jgi:hypothetical protein